MIKYVFFKVFRISNFIGYYLSNFSNKGSMESKSSLSPLFIDSLISFTLAFKFFMTCSG